MTTNKYDNPEPIFLTGGTGYLGTHLRRRFAKLGWKVTLLLRRDASTKTRPNEDIIRGDVTNRDSLVLQDHSCVVHLAAQTSVDAAIRAPLDTWEVNADGTANLLEGAREADIDRFVYTSTSSVYGKPEYLPIDEEHPTNPLEPYAASKLAGDRLANAYFRSYDFPVVVCRLFNTFGPGQPRYNVVPEIIEQIQDDEEVELGNLKPERDFIYIEDAVDAVIKLISNGEIGEFYNIGKGESIKIGELAKLAIEASGKDLSVVSRVSWQRDEDVEIPKHVADTSKIRSLGWEPEYTILKGLKETLDI